MEIKSLLLLGSTMMLLISCNRNKNISNHSHIDNNNDHLCDICDIKMTNHYDIDVDYICDQCGEKIDYGIQHAAPFLGGISDDANHSGYDFYKSNVNPKTTGTSVISIVGFNDFHGNIKSSSNNYGLTTLASYIKDKSARENTLILDQGDTWQGSIESNTNHGKLINDVLCYADVSLRTVGNHDFDWGISELKNLNTREAFNYTIPTLAANVYSYDWDTKTTLSNQRADIGKEYATFVIENGLKIGVIGVIGDEQITSICTQLVKDITFTDHIGKIKELSDYLRVSKDCDIIIASVHSSWATTINCGLDEISAVSGKRYTDLVLDGHSHTEHCSLENGLMHAQWSSDSISMGEVKLTYNFDSDCVENSTYNDYVCYNASKGKINIVDKNIELIVSNYLEGIKDYSSRVLSDKFVGTFESGVIENLLVEAIYFEAQKQGFDIDYSCSNYSRSGFYGTKFTYGDLYECFPFDNEVIIMEVSGSNLPRYFMYRNNQNLYFSKSKNYTIAVLDYVGYHINSNRDYDFFPNFTDVGKLTKKDGSTLTYRDILENYLLDNTDKTFNASDYSSGWHFTVYNN